MWSPPPEPTSQSLLNVNAIYQCQCDTSMSLTSVQIPSKCQRHLPPMSMLHIMPLTSTKTQKQYFEKQSKKKQYFETLWGGPHGENKKTQENYKKNNMLRLLAGPFTSPRPLEFVFSAFFGFQYKQYKSLTTHNIPKIMQNYRTSSEEKKLVWQRDVGGASILSETLVFSCVFRFLFLFDFFCFFGSALQTLQGHIPTILHLS